MNTPELQLHNVMEDLVVDWMEKVLKDFSCCKCEKCQFDIMALSLNKLRPHYVVTRNLYSKTKYLDQLLQSDIMTAVVTSVDYVSTNPRHD